MRSFVALLLLAVATPSASWADASAPSSGAPADRVSKLCQARAEYVQCGVIGPPCCLGSRLLLPSPRSAQLTYVVDLLGRVAAKDADEARFQLTTIRAEVPKDKAERLEALLRADPRLAKVVAR